MCWRGISYKKHQSTFSIEETTMKRRLTIVLTVLLIAAIVLTGVFISRIAFPAQISGEISSDTTWGAFGVYNLSGNVTVKEGVQLTIQPAAIVNLNGYTLQVDGTLYARGNAAAKIGFNSGHIIFTKTSTAWNEQTGKGSIIDNCAASTEIIIRDASPKITNSDLDTPQYESRVILVDGGAPIISNNQISGDVRTCVYGWEGGSAIEFWSDNNAVVTGNRIQNCITAVVVSSLIDEFNGTCTIEGNLIINNKGEAVYFGAPLNLVFKDNTVTQNWVAFRVSGFSNKSVFENNNIYGNTNRSIGLEQAKWATDMNASGNWWGTTDTNAISQSIHDSKADPKLGTVSFAPILQTQNPHAPKP
jgi:hypothetical protein